MPVAEPQGALADDDTPTAASPVWSGRDTLVLLSIIGLIAVVSTIALYRARPGLEPIRSDGVGYYAYLPQVLLRHDPAFEVLSPEVARRGSLAAVGFRRYPATGRYLDRYQIGEAVLLLPFFTAAHVIAIVTGAARTGFSGPYQAAVAAAAVTYLLVGLGLLCAALRPIGRRATVGWTVVVILFATNLFHYGTFDGAFSHVYSFALFCAVIVSAQVCMRAPTWRNSLLLGTTTGLFVLIRVTNVILALAVLAAFAWRVHDEPAAEIRRRIARAAAAGGCAVAVCVPQLVVWKLVAGKWIVNSYDKSIPIDKLDLSHPHPFGVLFSVQRGIFVWSPVLLLCVAGLWALRRRDAALAVAAAAALAVNTYLISSWIPWTFGGGFGHRAFVESLPLFAFGFAALVDASAGVWRRFLQAVSVVCVLVSLTLMLGYWRGRIPYEGATWSSIRSAFVPGAVRPP